MLAELERQADDWRTAVAEAERRASSEPVSVTVDDEAREESRLEAARGRDELAEIESQIAAQRDQLDEIRLRHAQVASRAGELRSQRDLLNARLRVAQARSHVAGGAGPKRSLTRPFLVWLAGLRWNRWTQSVASVAALGVIALLAVGIYRSFATTLESPNGVRPEELVESPPAAPREPVPAGVLVRRVPLRQLSGDGKVIGTIACSPNGEFIASGDGAGSVRIWNARTGTPLQSFQGAPQYGAHSLVFDHSSKQLACESVVWDVATGRKVVTLAPRPLGPRKEILGFATDDASVLRVERQSGGAHVEEVALSSGDMLREWSLTSTDAAPMALSPDGSLIAGITADGAVRLFDVATWTERGTEFALPSTDRSDDANSLRRFEFADDGRLLMATRRHAPHVLIWDVSTGRLVDTLSSNRVRFWGAEAAPDGRMIALIGKNDPKGTSFVDLWDRSTAQFRVVLELPNISLDAHVFTPDGDTLVLRSGTEPRFAQWDATPGPLTAAAGEQTNLRQVVSFRDRTLVLGATGKSLAVWDPRSGLYREFEEFPGTITTLDVSADGTLAVAGSTEGTLCLFNVADGKLLRRTSTQVSLAADRPEGLDDQRINDIAIAPNGRSVLVGTNKTMFIWNLATGGEEYPFKSVPEDCLAVALSPDGRHALYGGWNRLEEFGELRLFDVATGSLERRFLAHDGRVQSAAFSLRGGRLVTGGQTGTVHVWNVATGEELARFSNGGSIAESVAISPDGRRVAAVGHLNMLVWDVDSETVVSSANFSSTTTSIRLGRHAIAFSGDGMHVVTGGDMGRFWNLGKGTR